MRLGIGFQNPTLDFLLPIPCQNCRKTTEYYYPSIRLQIIMDTLFNFQAGVSNRIQNNVFWIPLFFFLNSDCVSKSAYPKKMVRIQQKRIQTYSIVSKRMQISVSKNPSVSKKMLPKVSHHIQNKLT